MLWAEVVEEGGDVWFGLEEAGLEEAGISTRAWEIDVGVSGAMVGEEDDGVMEVGKVRPG